MPMCFLHPCNYKRVSKCLPQVAIHFYQGKRKIHAMKEHIMKMTFSALFFVAIALAPSAVMAKGGNPKNNGNYDIQNENITPLYVWEEGRLVKNPQYFIERRSTKEDNSVAARERDESTQYD
ncbi:hypothetical protein D3C81_427140 [compost metagenome]